MDLRKALFGNIVLSGGSTLTRGRLFCLVRALFTPCPPWAKMYYRDFVHALLCAPLCARLFHLGS